MAYEVVIKKRFTNKFQKLLLYLEEEWETGAADRVENELYHHLEKLQKNPFTGSLQGREKGEKYYIY